MSTGFNNDYEQAIIRGNLSIEPSCNPLVEGDGSVEVAGSLYVDCIKEYTHTGGVCIGDLHVYSDHVLVPFSYPSLGFTSGSLLLNGGITIRNTTPCQGVSAGGALTVYGGASIVKGLCMGGNIDMNNNSIFNLELVPTSANHAASKWYVDEFSGLAHGNFTTGQVIIAESTGTSIHGFDTFIFDGTNLVLGTDTTFSIQSTLANSFTTLGGGSFGGILDMTDNRITNVADCVEDTDAVNLRCLEHYLSDCEIDDDNTLVYERSLTLETTAIPVDIPELEFSGDTVNFFECYIYTQSLTKGFSMHILRGFFNGVLWTMTVQYPGQGNFINYQIRTDGTSGIITYINPLDIPVYIKYRKYFEINTSDTGYEVFTANTTTSFLNIGGLVYDFNSVKGFKLVIVSDTAGFVLTGVYSSSIWSLSTFQFGVYSDIKFTIVPGTGQIQYKNTSSSETLSYKDLVTVTDTPTLLFNNSTFTPTDTGITGYNSTSYRTFTQYLYLTTPSGSSFYTIYGVFYAGPGIWSIHSQFSGAPNYVNFSIVTNGAIGTLHYTNTGVEDAQVAYSTVEFPPIYKEPICVLNGGTGVTDLLPYALLRGNGQNPVATSDQIIYYDNQLVLDYTSGILLNNQGVSFTSLGGGIFQGSLFVGETLDVNGKNIINVATPILGTDAVNRDYIDSLTGFTQGQVLVGASGGDFITSYPSFTFNTDGTLGVPYTSTGTLNVSGNANILGGLDVNGTNIINVATPILGTDAVNKDYITEALGSFGNELTQFTQGQILVGGGNGDIINGYPELTFNTGGVLNIIAETNINGILDMSCNNIINVLEPVNGKDAVNKDYLALWFECGFYGTVYDNEFEKTHILETTSIPLDIPGLVYTSRAFYCFIYIRNVHQETSAFYTIKAYYSFTLVDWVTNVEYTGDAFTPTIKFSVSPSGQVQYINNQASESIWIKYRMFYDNDSALTSITPVGTPVTLDTFYNNSVYGVKTNITNTDDNTIIYMYRNGTQWISQSVYFGIHPSQVYSINSTGTSGELQYTSTTFDSLYKKEVSMISSVVTLPDTLVYTQLLTFEFDPDNGKTFYLFVYTSNTSKAGLLEIHGVYNNSTGWRLNKRYIGDKLLNIRINGYILEYNTIDTETFDIGYHLSIPPSFASLCVTKGGTGTNEHAPGAVLLGNGIEAIIGTGDFVYYNNKLNVSGSICVNNIDITPSPGEEYRVASILNNQPIPVDVPGIEFSESLVKGVFLLIMTTITSTSLAPLNEMFEIKAINQEPGWFVDSSSVGDTSGIVFSINSGKLQYTSTSIQDWSSSQLRLRVISIQV